LQGLGQSQTVACAPSLSGLPASQGPVKSLAMGDVDLPADVQPAVFFPP